MLDFQKTDVLQGRLVHLEGTHDSQCRRALQRSYKPRAAIEEVWLPGPMFHLAGIQKERTGVRIERAAEGHGFPENLRRHKLAGTQILKWGGATRGEVPVYVDSLCYVSDARLKSIRLQQAAFAHPVRKPG